VVQELSAKDEVYPEILVLRALLSEDPAEREELLTQAEQRQDAFLFWRTPDAARREVAGSPILAPLRR